MQQSNVIFASLFIAFIVYITVRGELPSYINILKGKASTSTISPVASSNMPQTSFSNSSVEQGAEHLLSQVPGIQINAPAPLPTGY